jgi:hypothetical protein
MHHQCTIVQAPTEGRSTQRHLVDKYLSSSLEPTLEINHLTMRSAYSLVKARQRRNQAVGSNNAEESAKNPHQLQGPSNPRKQKHTPRDPKPQISGENTMNSAKDPIFVEDPAAYTPQTRDYLPIAMSRPDPPEEGAEMVDAEYEYMSVFEGPEDIAVPSGNNLEFEFHDDGLSAMSGLTGLNTLATFTQLKIDTISKASQYSNQMGRGSRDNQLKGEEARSRQVHREMPHQLQSQRRNTQKLDSPRKRSGRHRKKLSRKQNQDVGYYDEAQEIAADTQAYFEAELRNLPSIEEVLDDVESKVFNPVPPSAPAPQPRHGLPYEPTDYNADEEDSVIDPWDRVITPKYRKKAQERFIKLDPEECAELDDQNQGPPTPRKRLSDKMLGLVRETLSPKGDVVIDITDIEDDDIERFSRFGSNSNDNFAAANTTSTDEDIERYSTYGSNSNDHQTAAHSTKTRKRANKGMGGNSKSAQNFLSLRQEAQGTRPVEQSASSEIRKKVDVLRRARQAQSQQEQDNDNSSGISLNVSQEDETDDEQLVGESLADMDDDKFTPNVTPDMEANRECRDEEPERTQETEEDIFSSSFAYCKSVANDFGSQLRSIDISHNLESIQNIALISDTEIGKMLGVIEKGLKETAPAKRDPYFSCFGEGIDKTACGIDRTQGENDYVLSEEEVESATRVFQCGNYKPAPYQGEPTGLLQKRMEVNGIKPVAFQTYSVSVNGEAEQLQATVSAE